MEAYYARSVPHHTSTYERWSTSTPILAYERVLYDTTTTLATVVK